MESLHPNNIRRIHASYVSETYGSRDIDCLSLNNINYNYDVTSDLVSRVFIWFDKNTGNQICVTKSLPNESSVHRHAQHKKFIQQFNNVLKKKYFLDFHLVKHNDLNFVCMDFVHSRTFEQSLKRAINGPMKNLGLLKQELESQVSQMNELFVMCENCSVGGKRIDASLFRSTLLNEIAKLIPDIEPDRFSDLFSELEIKYTVGHAIPDLVNPNIFSGPVLIDNMPDDPEFFECMIGVELNRFRYVLLSLMSPPLSQICIGVVPTIMLLIADGANKDSVVINCYKGLLPQNSDFQTNLAMFVDAFIFEYYERSKIFHASDIRLRQIKTEFETFFSMLSVVDKLDFGRSSQLLMALQEKVNDQKYTHESHADEFWQLFEFN